VQNIGSSRTMHARQSVANTGSMVQKKDENLDNGQLQTCLQIICQMSRAEPSREAFS